MIRANNVHPLSDFQRNTRRHIARLRKSGEPAVLTVNGDAAVVVQDPVSYQQLVDDAERARTLEAIRIGLEQADRGEGAPAEKVFARLRRRVKTQNRK